MSWYDGLSCTACGRPLAATRREGRPLLRSDAGATVEPHRLSADEVEVVRATHAPICWACNLEAAFRPANAPATEAVQNGTAAPYWWVGTPCDVCGRPLARGWFWQERPRAVDRDVRSRDVRAVDRAACEGAAKCYVIACTDCYYNAYASVKVAAGKLASEPAVRPSA